MMVFVEGTHGVPYAFGENRSFASIEVPDFYIAAIPVTIQLWEHVMGGEGAEERAALPRLEVSWNHITEPDGFLARLNASPVREQLLAGLAVSASASFRLPTETEWEYAARGGKHWRDGFRFSGSNDIDAVAWYQDNSFNKPHPVAHKAPNQLGLCDMSGNVWEWCQDTFHRDVRQIPTDGSAAVGSANERILRGGCFHNWAIHCTVSKRYEIGREFHDGCIGFRLAVSAL